MSVQYSFPFYVHLSCCTDTCHNVSSWYLITDFVRKIRFDPSFRAQNAQCALLSISTQSSNPSCCTLICTEKFEKILTILGYCDRRFQSSLQNSKPVQIKASIMMQARQLSSLCRGHMLRRSLSIRPVIRSIGSHIRSSTMTRTQLHPLITRESVTPSRTFKTTKPVFQITTPQLSQPGDSIGSYVSLSSSKTDLLTLIWVDPHG